MPLTGQLNPPETPPSGLCGARTAGTGATINTVCSTTVLHTTTVVLDKGLGLASVEPRTTLNNYKCFTAFHTVLDTDTTIHTSTLYSTTQFHIVTSLIDTATTIDNIKYYSTTHNHKVLHKGLYLSEVETEL